VGHLFGGLSNLWRAIKIALESIAKIVIRMIDIIRRRGNKTMPDLVMQRLRRYRFDVQRVLESSLANGLEVTGAVLGIIQVMDGETGSLTFGAQRGFSNEFLGCFRHVKGETGLPCPRAIKERKAIIVEDVLRDRKYAPYWEVALATGCRAVQSTPLISSRETSLGVLTTAFPAAHRPSDREMQTLKVLGKLTADAISGLYTSASEVIREAVRLVEKQDHVRSTNLDQLRQYIRAANHVPFGQDIQAWLTRGQAIAWDAEETERIGFRATNLH
jgi:Arc/MetJ-type ribon-helix-helix transcriptional regulator